MASGVIHEPSRSRVSCSHEVLARFVERSEPRCQNRRVNEQRWALVKSEADGTEDYRLFTSAGDLALTLFGDMAFVGLWRETWGEQSEEILEERALDADELAGLLERAGIDTTEAAEIARSLWPQS